MSMQKLSVVGESEEKDFSKRSYAHHDQHQLGTNFFRTQHTPHHAGRNTANFTTPEQLDATLGNQRLYKPWDHDFVRDDEAGLFGIVARHIQVSKSTWEEHKAWQKEMLLDAAQEGRTTVEPRRQVAPHGKSPALRRRNRRCQRQPCFLEAPIPRPLHLRQGACMY